MSYQVIPCVRDAGAVGSNPITPTISSNDLGSQRKISKQKTGAELAHFSSQAFPYPGKDDLEIERHKRHAFAVVYAIGLGAMAMMAVKGRAR